MSATVTPKKIVLEENGFKLTDAGLIPADWSAKTVQSVGKVRGGKRLPPGFTLTTVPTPYPYIRVTDMRTGGVDTKELMYVPVAAADSIRNYRIFVNEVFITVAGTLGIVGVVPRELDGANLTENADKITDLNCDRDFLYFWLASDKIQRIIDSIKTVGAQPKLALGRIASFPIAVPASLDEQRAIAKALSDVDALIGALDKLIIKKHAIKLSTMQQLLAGQIRLPGFRAEWPDVELKSVLRVQVGFPFSSRYFTGHEVGLRLVKNRDLKSDDEVVYYNGPYREEFIVRDGDLLVGMDGDFAPCFWTKGIAVLNQRIGRIVPTDNFDLVFGSYFLKDPLKRIEDVTSSTTVKHLSHSAVENLKTPLPLIDEQRAIGSVLFDMDAAIAALRRRRDKTKAIKLGVMQGLLTGRTRLV